ncbi:MAG: hypothetical protein V4581_17190, partial [Bacteroidota bacterium]
MREGYFENRNKKRLAIYVFAFFIVVLGAFFSDTARNARNIKKVAVGMSYDEACAIMGNGARATSGGRPYNDSMQAKVEYYEAPWFHSGYYQVWYHQDTGLVLDVVYD